MRHERELASADVNTDSQGNAAYDFTVPSPGDIYVKAIITENGKQIVTTALGVDGTLRQSGVNPLTTARNRTFHYPRLNDPDFEEAMSQVHVWPITLDVCRAIADLDFDSDPADEIIAAARESAFVGTPEEVAEQIRDYAKLGVDLFMLQHFLLDDRDALELLAKEVMPAIA